MSTQAIIRFGLTDCLSSEKDEASIADFAAKSSLSEDITGRLLRHASANHVFQETHNGFFKHTAASQLLAKNPKVRQFVSLVTDEMWPAATRVNTWILVTVDSRVNNVCRWSTR